MLRKCFVAVLAIFLVLLAGLLIFGSVTPVIQTFRVDGIRWERHIPVGCMSLVEDSGWKLPEGATLIRTECQLRRYSSTGKVLIPIMGTKYYYKELRWFKTRSCDTAGTDKNAYWGNPALKDNEREGEREESYFFIVHTESGQEKEIPASHEVWEQTNVGDTIELQRPLAAVAADIEGANASEKNPFLEFLERIMNPITWVQMLHPYALRL